MPTTKCCIKCNEVLRCMKNAFYHLEHDGGVHTGDLYGCYSCGHLQIHGIPRCGPAPMWPVYARVAGKRDVCPFFDSFDAYVDPNIQLTALFILELREWYATWPHFNRLEAMV